MSLDSGSTPAPTPWMRHPGAVYHMASVVQLHAMLRLWCMFKNCSVLQSSWLCSRAVIWSQKKKSCLTWCQQVKAFRFMHSPTEDGSSCYGHLGILVPMKDLLHAAFISWRSTLPRVLVSWNQANSQHYAYWGPMFWPNISANFADIYSVLQDVGAEIWHGCPSLVECWYASGLTLIPPSLHCAI